MRIFAASLILFLCCALNLSAEEVPLGLTLEDCVEIALLNNQDLIKAGEEIKKTEGYLLEQFADFLPEVYLNYRYVTTSSPEARRIANDVFLYAESTAGLYLKEELFKGGERFYRYKSARIAVDRARESYLEMHDKLIFEVKKVYYDLLLAEELISLYSESKRRMEAYTSKLTRKSKLGDTTKYAVLRAKIEAEIMNADLIKAEKEKILHKSKLQKLLMLDEIRDISPLDNMEYPETETVGNDLSLESLLPAAEIKNRRIKVAKLAKTIGKTDIAAAISKTGLRASLRSAWYKSSDKFDLMSHYFYDWSFMINITVPLFDGFKTPSLINQSRSEYSKLVAAEAAARKDVFWELEDAVRELEKTKPLLASQKSLANDARSGVNMVLVLYDRGEGSEWDVIDAHRNYIRAESNLAKFVKEYNTLIAKIKYLISED